MHEFCSVTLIRDRRPAAPKKLACSSGWLLALTGMPLAVLAAGLDEIQSGGVELVLKPGGGYWIDRQVFLQLLLVPAVLEHLSTDHQRHVGTILGVPS